jgi:MFS family permease
MKSTDPPAIATALLERLVPTRTSVGLIGDLIEQRRNGRSRIWYWQQTIIALLTSAYRAVREHKVQTVSAIVIGYACGASLFYFSTAGAARFVDGYKAYLVFLPLGFLSAAISGWILSRTHPRPMLLVFAMFCVVGSGVAFAVYAVFPLDRLPLLELLFFAALDLVVWPAGVLAGGLLGAAHMQPRDTIVDADADRPPRVSGRD